MGADNGAGRTARLLDAVGGLTDLQVSLLARMAEALAVPVDVLRHPSDLVDDPFAETVANFLLLHHAIHEEPLNKAAFEYLVKSSADSGGHQADLNPSPGSATWDVRIDGIRWSLKTEAARGMSPRTVKIEKLMEARWIRECTNPARCSAAVRREVPPHMAGYDRILILRAFRLADGVRYDLVEPPKALLLQKLVTIPVDAFTKEGAKESYGANAETDDGGRVFRVLLDSSVEKVRLWFSVDHCRLHGSWQLTPSAVQQVTVGTA